jgi:6-phosphogluconolactonase
VFRIEADGQTVLLQQVSTGGDWPRFFLLLGRHLLACNQESDLIVVFDVAADGTLRPNGQTLQLKKPVCLVPVEA